MLSRIGLVVLCFGIIAGAAYAQQRGNQLWYQAYDAGVRDVGRGAWDSAVQNLQASKQGGPQPSRRVIFYGDRIGAFNPDYYLGVAYLNLRRFADADAAFARVSQASLIQMNDALYNAFQVNIKRATFEVAYGQAEAFLEKGDLDQAKQANDRAVAQGIDPDRVRAQTELLGYARAKIQVAGPVQPPPQPVPAPVTQPGPVAEVPPSPQPQPVPQPSVVRTPQPAVVQGPAPVNPTPVNPTPVQQAPNPAVLPRAVALQTGIAAYLQGRYNDAATLLAPAVADPQGLTRARFYLACSLAALVLSGDREETELANARAVLQLAGRLDQFAADRRVISPRVLTALGMQP